MQSAPRWGRRVDVNRPPPAVRTNAGKRTRRLQTWLPFVLLVLVVLVAAGLVAVYATGQPGL